MAIPVLKSPKASPVNPWGDDLLDRKELADNLTNLIRDLENQSLSICIDGVWGTGKTFFLERWMHHLEKVGFPRPIYFNAWEDDFLENPLISILGQLEEHLRRRDIADTQEILEKAQVAAFTVIRGLVRKGSGIDITDMMTGNSYTTYRELADARSVLIESLSTISKRALEKNEDPKPIVFIIDELDRCRPTFAIELLERVKHIFNQAPGIVFVFGLNRTELAKSVQRVYGHIDADIYLRRFFDHRLSLPTLSVDEYSKSLFEKLRINELLRHGHGYRPGLIGDSFRLVMVSIWQAFGLSLRDIEQTAAHINTVVRVMTEEQTRFIIAWEVGVLSTLRLKYPELYDGFISGDVHACDVVNEIQPLFANQPNGTNTLAFIEAYLYRVESRDYDRQRDSSIAFSSLYHRNPRFDTEHMRYFSNRVTEAAVMDSNSNTWANPRILGEVNNWLNTMEYDLGNIKPREIARLIEFQDGSGAN